MLLSNLTLHHTSPFQRLKGIEASGTVGLIHGLGLISSKYIATLVPYLSSLAQLLPMQQGLAYKDPM